MERPFWDGEKCVPCPEELPNLDHATGTCAAACPADKPYWSDFECLDCRTAYPLGDRPFWDTIGKMRLNRCPFGSPADSNNICQECAGADGDA